MIKMKRKVNKTCILAVKAAAETIGEYCGNRTDAGDILSVFVAALSLRLIAR